MRLLELCAAQGGATAGYRRAGWRVTAVDMKRSHAKYSPADEYHVGDMFDLARTLHAEDPFDAVHMSPPCQGYTRGNAGKETSWPKLIPQCRELGLELGIPFVIENVADARPEMVEPVTLCGCMFDLKAVDDDGIVVHLQRPRLFEAHGFELAAPRVCDHSAHEWVAGAYGGARRDKYEAKYVRKGGYVPPNKAVVKALLGVEHDMTWEGLFECIPPAYAEHVGRAMTRSVR